MSDVLESSSIELLTFRLADQDYALDIMSVREIRGWTRATPLPHAPAFMKGVINLRGTVLPIMDLACRLGLPEQKQNDRNVIIVVRSDEAITGLLVDAVSDIIRVSEANLQAPPDLASNPSDAVITALTLLDGRMIRILNLAKTVNPAEAVEA